MEVYSLCSERPFMKRLDSIDVMRATAILLMIQVHFVTSLAYHSEYGTLPYTLSKLLGMIPAPLFTFLVGVSLYLSLAKRHPREAHRRILRRAGALFAVGLIFNIVIWGPEYTFDWDVLTFISSAILIVYLLRHASVWGIMGVCLFVLVISPPLRDITLYDSHWDFRYEEYTYDLSPADLFLGWLLHGYFPLFGWIVYPLAGFAAGLALLRPPNDAIRRIRANRLIGVGGGLVAFSLIGWGAQAFVHLPHLLRGYLSPFSFYPASTTYVLLTLGLCLAGLGALWVALDAGRRAVLGMSHLCSVLSSGTVATPSQPT